MNTQKLNQLRLKAKTSLKILDMIEEGATAQELVARLGINRQLADYYLKAVNEAEKVK